MRQVGRLRSPRQPSWADAWPTAKPTCAGGGHEGVPLVDVEVPAGDEVVGAEQREQDPGGQEPVVDEHRRRRP